MNSCKVKWGFLRETSEQAEKAGIDTATGLHRTGLDEYLKVIFPNVSDWQHDKTAGIKIDGKSCKKRPDYRSEKLKLIIEFDGLPHYTNPDIIIKDYGNNKLYQKCGYKVVRIPYFIQLSNSTVKELFSISVKEKLFDESIPSLSIEARNTPAYLCPAGVERMKKEFRRFPNQYKINKDFLLNQKNDFLTGVHLI